ncbi:sulfatase-like hydrolase/transferase [Falsiruegeria mediterranea]|uniref:Choline-sulfatase n=1 Tax=Falsiruegeria mediterranea M17 TaxID=1200281 RepID=A0A2R8CC44_9RHOB|nr:sulfatase-like hydrolase/transferase [Falsiruegeria mediterranea]SPJ29968.1 Choline-sulfatase [Falsiruegeria mediterranea M17]
MQVIALITQTDAEIGNVIDAADALGLTEVTGMVYTSDHGEAIGAHGILGKANLYEHSAGVPLIMAGPGVPEGRVVSDNVSHVDLFPTMLDYFGVRADNTEDRLGQSLLSVAAGTAEQRAAFSEYHAMGSLNSSFLFRQGKWKRIYHVDMPNQLFDLDADPEEVNDLLAHNGAHPMEAVLSDQLRALVDPEALDLRSKADQRVRIEELGGLEVVRNFGSIAASPIPGEKVSLEKV